MEGSQYGVKICSSKPESQSGGCGTDHREKSGVHSTTLFTTPVSGVSHKSFRRGSSGWLERRTHNP